MVADRQALVELLEVFLLGSTPTLSGNDISARTGIDIAVARERWASLGFSAVEDDEVAFTEADLQAMELTQKLHELGLVDETDEAALIRTLGRSFARLAEWQLALVGRSIDLDTADTDELMTVLAEASPTIQEVMNYVWRRHMVAVGTRMLLAPGREPEPGDDVDPDSIVLAVGFADIVNYTRQSRQLSQQEIAAMVDAFEARALDIISSHGGRIIKTIGDEILFVVDTAASAALVGLELTEAHLADDQFPELRVGLAYGPVLARLGDVFGPTVNVASRLTGTSRT